MYEINGFKLRIPVVGSPMFTISNPKLVVNQCKSGIIGSFPALNAREPETLEDWLGLYEIPEEKDSSEKYREDVNKFFKEKRKKQ